MAETTEISFKSVGIKKTDARREASTEGVPIGLKTPMKIGQSNDGIFAMHFNIVDQIRDNLRNLLLTNHGERLALFDFGANLRPLTLELGTDTFDEELSVRIKTAVSKWMPFVDLRDLQRTVDNADNAHVAKISLRITYDIPAINHKNDALEINFFVAA